MANIANMAVKIGFDGAEALSGSVKISDAVLKVATAADKAAKSMNALDFQKFQASEATRASRMLMTAAEVEKDIARERLEQRLKGLNALEKQELLAAEKLKNRLMKMSAADIEREMATMRRAERLKGLNALEREELMAAEKLKQRLAGMTAPEIEKDIANRRIQERLKGLNALEREELLASEKLKAKLMGMSARDVERELARTRLAERLKGLNALEREEMMAAEKVKQRRMRMTADQIRNEIASEQAKAATAKRFDGLNALEKQKLMREDAVRARRMGMSATQIEREIQNEQVKERLKGMNALERREFMDAEKKRQRRMRMTADQIQAEIAAEEKARQAAPKAGTLFERLGIKGLADAKAGLEMIRGVMQTFVMTPVMAAVSIMKMGSALDNMKVIASGLESQLGGGAKAIESLRAISLETGAPLDDLNKAMLALSASGISLEESATMIGRASNAITLLGGGAEATNTVASALGSLQESARASEASLRPLQASGLNVFGALAKEISRSTGQAVTLAEAMEMLRQGSVLSSTAVRAVFTASNDAAAAADAVGNSFAGQLAKLSAGFDDLLRQIGSEMLKIFQPESGLSFLRGMFEGIKETVKGIADAMGIAVDPKDKGAKLKEIFESGKQFGEKLGKALIEGGKLINDVITKLLPDLQKIIKDIKDLDPGKAGGKLIAGAARAPFEGGKSLGQQIMSDIDKGFNLGIAPGKGKLNQIIAETERMKEAARSGKFDGEIIVGDFDNIEEALDGFDQVTEDFVAELIRQTQDLNQANRSAEQLRKEALRSSMTDAEKFTEMIEAIDVKLKQAGAASEGQQALLREALGRQVGAQIQSAITKFRQQQQDLPTALVAGSAAEVEARIRAERGMKTPEQEMIAALDAQTRQGEEQTAALQQLVALAAANGRAPATLVMPK